MSSFEEELDLVQTLSARIDAQDRFVGCCISPLHGENNNQSTSKDSPTGVPSPPTNLLALKVDHFSDPRRPSSSSHRQHTFAQKSNRPTSNFEKETRSESSFHPRKRERSRDREYPTSHRGGGGGLASGERDVPKERVSVTVEYEHRMRNKSGKRGKKSERKGREDLDAEDDEEEGTGGEKKKKKKKKKKLPYEEFGQFGVFGVLKEHDIFRKEAEFQAWLMDVKRIMPDTVSPYHMKQHYVSFMEDYNTATFPSKKYYNLEVWEALQHKETISANRKDGQVDLKRDEEELRLRSAQQRQAIKMAGRASNVPALRVEDVIELRRVQQERVAAEKLRKMGYQPKEGMGVRYEP